ncbi:MAG: aminotransferase class III-fold pyridoxal phosphate-dependent enzyme [Chloroflexi bacterium]|nr:aminotransferase class III-fold pyridoxal phosphate-dependent enzyme [Chloroflexota bacterium]
MIPGSSPPSGDAVKTLDRDRLAALMASEQADFVDRHPKAAALHERARRSLLAGVPMNWMVKWAGAFPLYVADASGAHVRDVDGHDYIDFSLGDTGAMAGHGAAPTIAAVERQLRRGITTMLPTEDAIWAGEELGRRFGLPYWQFTITATDANRFSLRLCRAITGRPLVAVHDHNYHGTVDETFAWLGPDGAVESRRGNMGPQVDPATTTRVVPFNDLGALEQVLADRQVAALLIEPALTNVGIVLPEPGYLDGVRELTRRYGTVLIHDETHTICAGPGGVTGRDGHEPDMLVVGKTIGGGIPVATSGMSAAIADRVAAATSLEDADVNGIGGTLAGYALSLAAVRATLGEVLTAEAFERMIPRAERWAAGVDDVLARQAVPWHVTRLGARAEYHFMPTPPRTGAEQWANGDFELERFLHLWAMNRGILMTPFHNMALMSPATSEADVDRHTEVFEAAVRALFG